MGLEDKGDLIKIINPKVISAGRVKQLTFKEDAGVSSEAFISSRGFGRGERV